MIYRKRFDRKFLQLLSPIHQSDWSAFFFFTFVESKRRGLLLDVKWKNTELGIACEQALRGALAAGGKRKESLQLRLWNLNSTSNSPVAPRRQSSRQSLLTGSLKGEIVLHTGVLWYIWNSLDRAIRDLRSKFDGQWTTLTEAPVRVAKSKLAAVAIFRSWNPAPLFFFLFFFFFLRNFSSTPRAKENL